MATTAEDPFNRELEVFRQEAAQCAQYLYAYLTIHAAAAADDRIRRALNENAIFWNTTLGSLQTSTFIALGRVFDHNGRHGPGALLRLASKDPAIFSKDSLRERKRSTFGNDHEGLEKYVSEACEPGTREFGRLERLVKGYSGIYDTVYRELRNRVFAHKVHTQAETVNALFSQTKVDELQRLVTFLSRFHDALRGAFNNGTRLSLCRARHSVHDMLLRPRGRAVVKPVSEETNVDTKNVLDSLARSVTRK